MTSGAPVPQVPANNEVRPRPYRLLAVALTGGVVVLALAALVARVTGTPVGSLTRDVATICAEAGTILPPYTGAIALLTLMTWASAASLALLAAVLAPGRRRWLLLFAVFVLVLAADDSLSLHETVGPNRGVPEAAFYLLYLAVAVTLTVPVARSLVAERRLAPAAVSFLLGSALLAVSILADQVVDRQHLVEDGPKLLGALAWALVPVLTLPLESVARLRESPAGW